MKFNYKKLIVFIVLLCCFTVVHADNLIADPTLPSGNLTECSEILGANLSAIIKVAITVIQIVAAIIAIVKGMMVLIPPILAKDADALKKAGSTLVKMAIILVIIFLFRPLLAFLGDLLDFDTSCILFIK